MKIKTIIPKRNSDYRHEARLNGAFKLRAGYKYILNKVLHCGKLVGLRQYRSIYSRHINK